MYNDAGAVINPTLRNYRIPAMADAPDTDVFFADTHDTIGPLGRKIDRREYQQSGRPRRSATLCATPRECGSRACRSPKTASSTE